MAAQIVFNQVGIPPTTSPGARTDGLDNGAQVTVSNASGQPCRVEFWWVPPDDGSVEATLAQASSASWTFNAQATRHGSYLVRMVEAEGTQFETEDIKLFGIRLPNSNLLIPALNEKGDPTVTLASNATAKERAARVSFNDEPNPEGLRWVAWWQAMRDLIMAVENGGGGGGGGSPGGPPNALQWNNGAGGFGGEASIRRVAPSGYSRGIHIGGPQVIDGDQAFITIQGATGSVEFLDESEMPMSRLYAESGGETTLESLAPYGDMYVRSGPGGEMGLIGGSSYGGNGGRVNVTGGYSYNALAGNVSLRAGESFSGVGGDVNLIPGRSQYGNSGATRIYDHFFEERIVVTTSLAFSTANASGSGDGGSVTFLTGNGSGGTGRGGDYTFRTGTGGAGRSGGFTFTVGSGGGGGSGGFAFTGTGGAGGSAGDFTVTMGDATGGAAGSIKFTAGKPNTGTGGGNIELTAGSANSSSAIGGRVDIKAGAGSTSTGGAVNLFTQDTSGGSTGGITLTTGNVLSGNQSVGTMIFTGGAAANTGSGVGGGFLFNAGQGGNGSGTGGVGGAFRVNTGHGRLNGDGGDCSIITGQGAGTGHGGDLRFQTAQGNGTGRGGDFNWTGGGGGTGAKGGSLTFTAGPGGTSGGVGGEIRFDGGSGVVGGNVTLKAGAGLTAGVVLVEGWSFTQGTAAATVPLTNAAGVLTNNGTGTLSWTQNIVGLVFTNKSLTTVTTGAAPAVNWTNGNSQQLTLSANATPVFTAPAGPCGLTLRIVQGGSPYTVTWPATVKWAGGAAPVISTGSGAIDIVSFYFDGTNYYGSFLQNFS